MEKQPKVIPINLRDPKIPEKAKNRLSVLLDMNVWIDLSEEKNQQALRLREKLQRLTKRGALFCPLTPTIIWELYRQSQTSAIKTATLMEELSLGISFAPTEEIYLHEVDAAFEAIYRGAKPVVDPVNLYVPIIAQTSSIAQISFPNAAAFKDPNELADMLGQQLRNMGLVDFCSLMPSLFSQPESPAPGFKAAGSWKREFAGKSREKARRVEEEAVLRSTVTPRITELYDRLPWHMQLEFYARLEKLPRDRYGGFARQLISSMPSVNHRIEVLSLVGQDPGRNDRMTDFFDLELIMAPYVYSTTLVTKDGWIRSILKSLGGEYRCLWTHDAFEDFLDGLEKHTA
jgi:hypothetical protein